MIVNTLHDGNACKLIIFYLQLPSFFGPPSFFAVRWRCGLNDRLFFFSVFLTSLEKNGCKSMKNRKMHLVKLCY